MFGNFLKLIKDVFLGPRLITQYEDMLLQEEAKKVLDVNPQITDAVTQESIKPKRTRKTPVVSDTPKQPKRTKNPKE